MTVRKFVAVFVLGAFCLFSWSCGGFGVKKTVKNDVAAVDRNNTDLRIVNVITKSGKNIVFKEKEPARFLPDGSAVVGITLQDLELAKADIKTLQKDKKGKIERIETNDGRAFIVVSATEDAERVLFSANAPIRIPSADIQQVWIRKTDVGMTVLISVVIVAAGIALMAILVHSLDKGIEESTPFWESCPFVYSYNGEEYVLDAEPYGMAISEGLQRTDWVEMSNLRDVGGKYRVLLANELDETQYTDELKLVVVDHAAGVKIAPDVAGRMHTFERPLPPLKAVDREGRDILPFVAENDRVFWVSRLEGKSPDDAEMRDELVMEFAKPAAAKKAKLLANVWTTQWGSLSTGKFLGLFGSSLPEQYADVDRFGPTYGRLMSFMSNEELYTLKVWVETPSGWKARGMIIGGAPVIAKDKAYLLDVSDVPGEVLRIKLRPPVNFWMVNSLAVDYGEDSPVRVTELAAETAVDQAGRDVRGELAGTDRSYLASPDRGERTDLVFPAPPARGGLDRTVFVKASGFYNIHVDARGEPQTALIDRVLGEPGFAARYSFREYLEWEAGLRARLEKPKGHAGGSQLPSARPDGR
jgi:hypothetical protein